MSDALFALVEFGADYKLNAPPDLQPGWDPHEPPSEADAEEGRAPDVAEAAESIEGMERVNSIREPGKPRAELIVGISERVGP